jgi:hypothetical protein
MKPVTIDGHFSHLAVDPEWVPPKVPASWPDRIEREVLPVYRAYLNPAEEGRIMARVVSLLTHYYVSTTASQVSDVMLEDWLNALGDYPWWAITRAVDEWLRTERVKPHISDICEACESAVRQSRVELALLERVVKHARAAPQITDQTDGRV